jgi:hypothetical protein
VYTIARTDDTNTLHGCEGHFENIKRQCTAETGHQGGTVLASGVLFEVYHDEATHLQTAGQGSRHDHRSAVIATGIARPLKRATQPKAPKNPTTPKIPTALKTPTTPKNPASQKNPPKACPLKSKGKSGKSPGGKARKRADTSNPDCDDKVDYETI